MIHVEAMFDERTWTLSYVVFDPDTLDAIVIDPVLDYEPGASRIWTESVDRITRYAKQHGLRVHAVLETHAHADHLSGSQIIKESYPEAQVVISRKITQVQLLFKGIFGLPAGFAVDGSQFDRLIDAGEQLTFGALTLDVIPTPGHTPACVSYLIEDAMFVGDALFNPDVGTGRCDFPGGSAYQMYDSIMRLYDLPADTRVYTGHDYPPEGRDVQAMARLDEHRAHNVALPASRSREDFVAWREDRDATLSAPKLLFQSVQVNVDAGALPQPDANQVSYLRIPINVFRPEARAEEADLYYGHPAPD